MEFPRISHIIPLLIFILPSCDEKTKKAGEAPVYSSQQFHDYWHAGKAEVNLFPLRYSAGKKPGSKEERVWKRLPPSTRPFIQLLDQK